MPTKLSPMFVANNRVDFAIRTRHGLVFSVHGQIQHLKIVKSRVLFKNQLLHYSEQGTISVATGQYDALSAKLDDYYDHMRNQTHMRSNPVLVNSLMIRTAIIICLVVLTFGSLNLNTATKSTTEVSSVGLPSLPPASSTKFNQSQSIQGNQVEPEFPVISKTIQPTKTNLEGNNFNSSNTMLSQLENLNFNETERESLLKFLELMQTNEIQESTDELINALPQRVVNFLIETGILSVKTSNLNDSNLQSSSLTLIPEHIMAYFQDSTGIASIPRKNNWVMNNGLILLPLPGGGDIKSESDFSNFGLELK